MAPSLLGTTDIRLEGESDSMAAALSQGGTSHEATRFGASTPRASAESRLMDSLRSFSTDA